MKRKILFSSIIFLLISICFLSQGNQILGKEDGAPTFCTGSPGDGGLTCAQTSCHTGNSVITQTGMITSNIPGTGYIAGSVYTFTVSVSKTNTSVFGFEVSPQATNGNKLGTMIVTNATETQLVGSSKFLTHTITGITGSNNSKSWSFNWTAPAAGTGSVTFYGCLNASNGDHTKLGDQIYKTTVTYPENTTGINTSPSIDKNVTIYPMPAKDNIYINAHSSSSEVINISLYDINGKLLITENHSTTVGDNSINIPVNELTHGVYFLSIIIEGERLNKKIVID